MPEHLITDRVRTGRSALLWRDSDEVWRHTEGVPTIPIEPPEPDPILCWPLIDYRESPPPAPEPLPRWSLMTRIRLRLAAWLIGI